MFRFIYMPYDYQGNRQGHEDEKLMTAHNLLDGDRIKASQVYWDILRVYSFRGWLNCRVLLLKT